MLIGSITNYGSLQGQTNDYSGQMTGIISSAELMGGQIVGMRGLKGDKGDQGDTGATGVGIASIAKTSSAGLVDTYTITFDDGDTETFSVTNGQDGTNGVDGKDGKDGTDGTNGADGFSPIATVTKSGDTATISITDANGTTTATISDGVDGAFIAEYGVTSYQEVIDAVADGCAVLMHLNDYIDYYYPLLRITSHHCYFAGQYQNVLTMYVLTDSDTWIESTNTFSLSSHDHGNIQNGGTLQASDVTIANGDKLVVTDSSNSDKVARASIAFDGSTTNKFLSKKGTWESAGGGGGGGVTDVEVDGTSVVTGGVAEIDLTGKSDVGHTHTVSDVTDFPTIPTDTGDLTNGAGFISSETDPVFSASDAAGITSSDISNWNGKADAAHTHTKSDITDYPTTPILKTASKQSNTITVSANAIGQGTIDMSSVKPDGYTLIGVAGFYCTASGAPPISVYVSGTDTVSVSFRNVTTSSVNQKLTAVGLYLRDTI